MCLLFGASLRMKSSDYDDVGIRADKIIADEKSVDMSEEAAIVTTLNTNFLQFIAGNND